MHEGTVSASPNPNWQLNGLLFENCSCQLLCPAHVSFKQTCEGERCNGHWIFHIDAGNFEETDLGNTNIAVVFDAPATMYRGGWTQVFYIDDRTNPQQRQALEKIFSGTVGGPWEVLNRFVSHQLETRTGKMHFEDNGRDKSLTIDDLFDATVTAIRGSDGDGDAVISNLHNVIHGPVHTLAKGTSSHSDPALGFELERTHAIYSYFSWKSG